MRHPAAFIGTCGHQPSDGHRVLVGFAHRIRASGDSNDVWRRNEIWKKLRNLWGFVGKRTDLNRSERREKGDGQTEPDDGTEARDDGARQKDRRAKKMELDAIRHRGMAQKFEK